MEETDIRWVKTRNHDSHTLLLVGYFLSIIICWTKVPNLLEMVQSFEISLTFKNIIIHYTENRNFNYTLHYWCQPRVSNIWFHSLKKSCDCVQIIPARYLNRGGRNYSLWLPFHLISQYLGLNCYSLVLNKRCMLTVDVAPSNGTEQGKEHHCSFLFYYQLSIVQSLKCFLNVFQFSCLLIDNYVPMS